jgi:hypothetical protein
LEWTARQLKASDASTALDWTTPGLINTSTSKIQIGTSAATDAAGQIRWTGSDFEGYNGSSWVSFTTGGSITGSGAANQVAYWSGASALTGSSDLTFTSYLLLTRGVSTDPAYATFVTGDSFNRVIVQTDGVITAGDGTATPVGSIDLFGRTLQDTSNNSALTWENRQLLDPGSNSVLDWATTGRVSSTAQIGLTKEGDQVISLESTTGGAGYTEIAWSKDAVYHLSIWDDVHIYGSGRALAVYSYANTRNVCTIQSDGQLVPMVAAATDVAFAPYVTGDSLARFTLKGNGKASAGNGSSILTDSVFFYERELYDGEPTPSLALKWSHPDYVQITRALLLDSASPVTPINGMIRYNSSAPGIEGYLGGAWVRFSGASAGTGVNTRVAYWTGDSTLGSSSTFTFSAGTLSVGSLALTTALPVTSGGTSFNTFTTGDTLYCSATNTLSKLAIGTAGQVLVVSGGVPSWSAITLSNTSSVTGTLAATNGGTGFASYAVGDLIYASTTTAFSKLAVGTAGQVLTVSGGVPTWATPSSGAAFSALTSGTNTTAAMVVGAGATLSATTTGTITATGVVANAAASGPATGTAVAVTASAGVSSSPNGAGDGGAVNITAGAGSAQGSGNAAGGAVNITTGAAQSLSSRTGGALKIIMGAGSGGGLPGTLTVTTASLDALSKAYFVVPGWGGTGGANTFIGQSHVLTGVVSGTGNTVIGNTINLGTSNNSTNTLVGYDLRIGDTIAQRNVLVGNTLNVSTSEAVCIGESCTIASGHTGSIALGYGSTTSAAAQVMIGATGFAYYTDFVVGGGNTTTNPTTTVWRTSDGATATAGGALTLRSGNGGSTTTGTCGLGGAINITAGNAGAASGAGISNQGGAAVITAGNGGNTVGSNASAGTGGLARLIAGNGSTATSTFNAGNGGAAYLTAGAGGGTASGTAGSGGAVNITSGTAGNTSGAGTSGAGGALTLTTGSGGTTVGGTSGAGGALSLICGSGGSNTTGSGGLGNDVTINSGTGGAVSTGAGGSGGGFSFIAGTGGAASSAGGTGGFGGQVILQAGTGGGSTTAAAGAGGDLFLRAGNGGTASVTAGNSGVGGVLSIESGVGGSSSVSGGSIRFKTAEFNSSSTRATIDKYGAWNFDNIATNGKNGSASSQGKLYYDSTPNKFRVSENGGTVVDLVTSDVACQCRLNATTVNITSGSDTTIAFGSSATENFDTHAMHDPTTNNTRITVPIAGRYLVIGFISFGTNSTGNRRGYILWNNSVVPCASDTQANTAASQTTYVSFSAVVNCAANDFFELVARQDSGSTLVADGNTTLTVQRVG